MCYFGYGTILNRSNNHRCDNITTVFFLKLFYLIVVLQFGSINQIYGGRSLLWEHGGVGEELYDANFDEYKQQLTARDFNDPRLSAQARLMASAFDKGH